MVEYLLDMYKNSKANSVTQNSFQQSLPFCVASCGELFATDKYFTKRDGLDNYLLFVTVDGLGKMTCNGQTCLLEPGSALIIDCNNSQDYRTAENHTWHFYYLHFNALSMSGYSNLLFKQLTPVILRQPDYVVKIMEEIYRLSFGSESKTYIQLSNHISNILTEMVCSLSDGDYAGTLSYREDINALQKFIQNNFQSELHIDDFMKHTNLSRHYLIHTFKRQIGISPYQYMHMCRINHAQKLLTTTDMSISQIAEISGYNSSAVFIRHFKFFNKTTPAKYRSEFLRHLP